MPPTSKYILGIRQILAIWCEEENMGRLGRSSNALYFFLIVIFLFGKNKVGHTQDMRLAQFYKAPQLLNPAMTGVFTGSFRFHLNYRDQWSSILDANPFRTENIGIDFRKNSFGNDFFGLGLNTYLDGAGRGHFQQTRVHLSGSYAKQMAGDSYSARSQYLILGGQVGFGQNTLDWNQLWFSDQFDNITGFPAYDTPSSEGFLNENTGNTDLFLDVNIGLLWYVTLAESQSLYFGAALNHINSPNISFVNDQEELDWRIVVHGGGEFPIGQGNSFLPAFSFQRQGDRTSVSVGTNFRFSNNDWNEMAFRIGVWPHFSSKENQSAVLDEWSTALILEWNKWDIGMSYGINTSALNSATLSRGAFELSMTYVVASKERFKLKCPKF